MEHTEIVERVLAMLEKQRFADWHVGKFQDWITGDMEHETKKTFEECKEIIKEDISKMLHLTK